MKPSASTPTDGPLDFGWESDPLTHMVRACIAFVQTVFEEAPDQYFRWRPSLEETRLVITEENPVKLDTIERKPCVAVMLGPSRFNGTSLDDLQFLNFRDGTETHTDLISGTISLQCMSRVQQEARFIGWQIARFMWILRKMFVRERGIHEFGRNITIGGATPAGALVVGDTEAEWVSVPIHCPFYLQWRDSVTCLKEDWDGRPISPLRQMELRLKTRLTVQGAPRETVRAGGLSLPKIHGRIINPTPGLVTKI